MKELEEYRKEIDEIDKQIVELFEKRMDLSGEISKYKSEHHLPILNKGREEEVLEKNISRLQNKEYSQMARGFFETIMRLSKEHQQILNNG